MFRYSGTQIDIDPNLVVIAKINNRFKKKEDTVEVWHISSPVFHLVYRIFKREPFECIKIHYRGHFPMADCEACLEKYFVNRNKGTLKG